MNERIKNAIESMENKRLKLDDTLSFSCTCCGGCCVHQENLILNPLDLFRMAKELGITIEQWMEQYGECYIGEDSRIPIVRIHPQGKTRRCPLLKNNKCSVHKVKPSVCGLYPLGRTIRYAMDDQGKTRYGKIRSDLFSQRMFLWQPDRASDSTGMAGGISSSGKRVLFDSVESGAYGNKSVSTQTGKDDYRPGYHEYDMEHGIRVTLYPV